MVKNVYYLKNSKGYIECVFVVDDASPYSVTGRCYQITSWGGDKKPVDDSFFARVYCKWDACTHWHFSGEDHTDSSENVDAYYHICGSHCVLEHVRAMCFIWKLVADIIADLSKKPDDPYNPDIIEEYFDGDDISNLVEVMLKDYVIEKEDTDDE